MRPKPEELELTVPMGVLKFFEEAPAEQTREHPHWKEEARLARHPPVRIEAAAGHDAVHMRMMSHRRAPRAAPPWFPSAHPSASDRRRACATSPRRRRTIRHK